MKIYKKVNKTRIITHIIALICSIALIFIYFNVDPVFNTDYYGKDTGYEWIVRILFIYEIGFLLYIITFHGDHKEKI